MFSSNNRPPVTAFLAVVTLAGIGVSPAAAQFSTPTPSIVPPRFSISQAASTDVLAAGQQLELTVTIQNVGSGAADPGVATIRFSPGLEFVDGLGAWTSQGTYDPARGIWEVGALAPIGEAVLVLPARVRADVEAPCVFSLAEIWPDGPDGYAPSQKAFATLRAPGVERCVDLVAGSAGDPSRGIWNCDDGVTLTVPVANLGPDPARDVLASVRQDPAVLPQLVFADTRCDPPGTATCRLPLLPPGSLDWAYRLELQSAAFRNRAPAEMTLTVAIASSDVELEPGNEEADRTLTIYPPDACPTFAVSGAACFIATAAWGSPLNAHVQSLRGFRDRYLLTHAPGRALVATYYRYSPPLAAYIAARPAARAVARAMLWPLVFAIEQPALCLALCAGAIWGLRRRRAARGS